MCLIQFCTMKWGIAVLGSLKDQHIYFFTFQVSFLDYQPDRPVQTGKAGSPSIYVSMGWGGAVRNSCPPCEGKMASCFPQTCFQSGVLSSSPVLTCPPHLCHAHQKQSLPLHRQVRLMFHYYDLLLCLYLAAAWIMQRDEWPLDKLASGRCVCVCSSWLLVLFVWWEIIFIILWKLSVCLNQEYPLSLQGDNIKIQAVHLHVVNIILDQHQHISTDIMSMLACWL